MTVTLDSVTLLWIVVLGEGVAVVLCVLRLRKALDPVLARIGASETVVNTKLHEMNVRIVDLETEPEKKPKSKDDDDMMASANSWTAQVAAAERGEGVRF